MCIWVYKYVCSNKKCARSAYSDNSNGIHFWSTKICAVQSIAWEFVHFVEDMKCSFTAFRNQMTRRYKNAYPNSAPFMSTKVFVKWFISWICCHKIDFRESIDPWCKYEPTVLVGELCFEIDTHNTLFIIHLQKLCDIIHVYVRMARRMLCPTPMRRDIVLNLSVCPSVTLFFYIVCACRLTNPQQ